MNYEDKKGIEMEHNDKILYIVIPAYNEEENIETVIRQWYPIVEKFGSLESRLVIVNDGSKDNTAEKVRSLKSGYSRLVLLNKTNGGHGSAVIHGYRYAISKGADYIFQTDSDGQTDPGEFDSFYEAMKEYDAAIGCRPGREDGIHRAFVEKVLCMLLRVIFGVRVKDSNAPFRLVKSELLKKYIYKLPKEYTLPNVMLTTFFCYYHEKVVFIDISFRPRQGGNNSINIKRIFKIGVRSVRDFIAFRRKMLTY